MLQADNLHRTQALIDGRWVVSRPIRGSLFQRLRDALSVLIGNADAVTFWKQ
jgi:hypothetical protein